MDNITVNYEGKPCYNIYLEHNFYGLREVLTSLEAQNRNICIVTDSTVGAYYLEEVKTCIRPLVKEVFTFTFPAGEQSKNLAFIHDLYETLIVERFDRKDILIALGGGVVGDMTGFAAATYLRGIRFVQIPTSLLAMVDSSIGGKTGVDYKSYKNMIGAFHQPSAVYMNLSALKTLTSEQYSSGLGEIVKHALIKNSNYYEWLKKNVKEIIEQNPKILYEMIRESLLIKKSVVENDPKELGERALLNFGHTLGHAIEKHLDFTMLHGDCVAVGSLASSYISCKRGYITEDELKDIRVLIESLQMPVVIPKLNIDEVIATTKSDKKMEAGQIKFILLKKVGDAFIDSTVSKEEMKEAMMYIMQ